MNLVIFNDMPMLMFLRSSLNIKLRHTEYTFRNLGLAEIRLGTNVIGFDTFVDETPQQRINALAVRYKDQN